jgi:MoxR-like ATPase
LFGPLSLKALEDDRYERLTEGFLPTAGIAFLDEVFKANSAILNALLMLLNERCFDNGTRRVRTPLVAVVAASNEVPTDEALHAFYDRFLVRVPVAPVSDAAFGALLTLAPEAASSGAAPLAAGTREAITAAAAAVPLGAGALAACGALRRWLQTQDIAVSDRRWRQWIGLMRTAAATEGRQAVDAIDLWTAPYVVSPAPEAAPRIAQWFEAELLQAVPQDAPWLTRAVEAFEKQLEIEEAAPAEGDVGDGAGKLALAKAIGRGEGDGRDETMLRIVSEQLEASLRRHYSSVHVAARLAQVDEVLAQAAAARTAVAAERHALDAALAPRVWMPPTLVQRLTGAHLQTLRTLDGLIARLQRTRAGFGALPIDDRLDAVAPEPVTLSAESR